MTLFSFFSLGPVEILVLAALGALLLAGAVGAVVRAVRNRQPPGED